MLLFYSLNVVIAVICYYDVVIYMLLFLYILLLYVITICCYYYMLVCTIPFGLGRMSDPPRPSPPLAIARFVPELPLKVLDVAKLRARRRVRPRNSVPQPALRIPQVAMRQKRLHDRYDGPIRPREHEVLRAVTSGHPAPTENKTKQ